MREFWNARFRAGCSLFNSEPLGKKVCMKNTAILILEKIWWDLNQQNRNQASVLHYFEGLHDLMRMFRFTI